VSACACEDELADLRRTVAGLELTLLEVRSLLRLQGGRVPAPRPARSVTAPVATAQEAYARVLVQLPQVVAQRVPADARVLVVSRGDDRLLAVPDRRTGHFPQAGDGAYAGHHPHDSETAVAELERLRADGWTALVFPSTALWWLEHYAGLRRHLEATAQLLHRDDLGVVYGLVPVPTRPALEQTP
jgi:hypothetical protein